jgi:PKD repeat protein
VPAVSAGAAGGTSDEIHYTFTGATSVAFDWRGTATSLDYGLTTSYGATVTAVHPTAAPFSSAGPFWEAAITGLAANTTYHYSIGGGPDATFHTAPTGDYSVVAVGDLLDSGTAAWETQLHQLIAAQNPSFVMMLGDLTYANENCQPAVDIHFNDAMVWSRTAAYMPVWGNHEYGKVTAESKPCAVADDFRNYKGRFALPNPKTLSVDTATKANGPGCPLVNGTNPCRGEDWGWFDAGAVRWITGPEVWPGMVSEWRAAVAPIMAAAQADPNITTIVTASHRPGYSSRSEQISPDYTTALNSLGDAYPKFKLHLNGHTHALEVFTAQHGVVHVTAGGGGAVAVQQPPLAPGSVFFSRHPGFTRIDVAGGGVTLQTVCGPDNGKGIDLCTPGETTYGPVTITPPADGPPVAVASGSCAELSCTFDGTGSRDPGGTITDYSWAFGDGTSGTGAVVSHTYATPGTYTATLTVTGSDGGTASATTTITAQPMTFVGLRSTNATVKTATVTVPSGVTAGDGLLLVETVASTTVSIGAPTGAGTWTLLGTQEAGSMVTRVYARTAAAGDAGRTVSVALGDYAKIALQLAAYRGTRAGSPVASVVMAPDTTNSASHTTPTVTVSAPTWVVTVWADKSTSTTQWTVPSAVVTRDVLVGSGSGYLSAVLADSGATVPAGTYGGLVASTNQPTTKAVTATIVLAPA